MDPGPSFSDVQQTVQASTGDKIAWRQNSEEDRDMEKVVDRLLARTMTADKAVQVALLNNPTLQAIYEEIGISQADLVQAGLLKNPEFTNLTRFPDQGASAADVELSVAQDFLDLFTLPLRKKVAETQLEQTKLEVGDAVLNLAADVKEAFYTLQSRQQLLQRLERLVDVNQTGAELAAQQNQAGTLNELETEKQGVLYNQSKADLSQVRVEIDADREKLNRLMGLSGHQLDWKSADKLPKIPEKKFSVAQVESLAMAQRLDVAAQQQYNYMLKGTYDLLEAKQHEIEAERSSIEASRDYWVARAALERAVGGSLNSVAIHVTRTKVNVDPGEK